MGAGWGRDSGCPACGPSSCLPFVPPLQGRRSALSQERRCTTSPCSELQAAVTSAPPSFPSYRCSCHLLLLPSPPLLPSCSRHGILIVEDDPYFYLQFPSGPQHPPGLAGLPRASSYLSLDTQGRVIRLDSFAKFLAPGLRLGWAAAPPAVIDKMTQVMQAQTLGASGVSQVRQHGWGGAEEGAACSSLAGRGLGQRVGRGGRGSKLGAGRRRWFAAGSI